MKSKKNNQQDTDVLDQLIKTYLSDFSGKYFNYKQLSAAKTLKGKFSASEIKEALQRLYRDQKIESDGREKYRIPAKSSELIGVLRIAKDGYGFVTVEGAKDDYFVPEQGMLNALSGDTVRIRTIKSGGRRTEAKVLEVVERGKTHYVATLRRTGRGWRAIVEDGSISQQFMIVEAHIPGAEDGDKVQIKFIDWIGQYPDAEVVRVLGKSGEHHTEMHAILLQYGFEVSFPDFVQKEADKIPREITAKEIKARKDFREVLTITIDPHDAKDFDDAISYQKLPNGNTEVGVHIADVAHYLKAGTPLDAEAYRRATSVYLVDRTVPMLPEILSNDLCSLRPNEDKLVFSAVFEFDAAHKVKSKWFGKAIIHSDKRFAYEEVQEILDAKSGLYADELTHLNTIAYALRKERFAQGSINFETDEVKFKLDEAGKPLEVILKIRKDAHKLIEDFMLLANKEVATWAHGLSKKEPYPFVYRIHDLPDQEKLNALQMFVAQFGHKLEVDTPQKAIKSLNTLILDVEGKPEQNVVQNIAIRSMAKAIYTTKNIGHYGLGFKFYSHFTSPIRRYPDVLAHRLMEQYLAGNFKADVVELEKMCRHSSDMEKKAAEAERASVKYKQAEYLTQFIGSEFDGIISGVTNWGLYVELKDNKCEGMLRLASLTDDMYDLDERNYRIVGRRTGKIFRLGDEIRVRISKTDILKRSIDFEPAIQGAPMPARRPKFSADTYKPTKQKKKRKY